MSWREGRGTDDPLSCSYYALQGLLAGYSAAAVPHSDAAGQDALGGSKVEGVHDADWCSGSFQLVEEVEALLIFLTSEEMLLLQERSSVRCTPRNLVLLTLSEGVLQ